MTQEEQMLIPYRSIRNTVLLTKSTVVIMRQGSTSSISQICGIKLEFPSGRCNDYAREKHPS